MEKRNVPKSIKTILKYDAELTKNFVLKLTEHNLPQKLKTHCKFLELSCNGIVWLTLWIGFIWLLDSKSLYEMQINMLFGLLLDIFAIAILKSYFRRRRPSICDDMLQIGPDKFSFPSGHASRASFVLMFFTFLYPISSFFWLLILTWTLSVSISRIILQRHFILDIVCGIILGVVEVAFLSIFWISENSAVNIINLISNDVLPEMDT